MSALRALLVVVLSWYYMMGIPPLLLPPYVQSFSTFDILVFVVVLLLFSLQSYVALAKGGLVPEHVLVLPIDHFAASTDLAEVKYTPLTYTTILHHALQYCANVIIVTHSNGRQHVLLWCHIMWPTTCTCDTATCY